MSAKTVPVRFRVSEFEAAAIAAMVEQLALPKSEVLRRALMQRAESVVPAMTMAKLRKEHGVSYEQQQEATGG